MSMRVSATGTIEAKTWNFEPIEELGGGSKLIRMSATDLFHGDIEGEARAEFVAMVASGKSSEFAGIYRFSGSLNGRQGTFLLNATGASDTNGATRGTWRVIDGSGTRELSGVKGMGAFAYRSGGPSSLTLDYDLDF